MRSREELGQYVLLKKLSEDPLGESYRAGRVGSQGLEQVVLLRVFNGRRIDSSKLWQRIAERGKAVQAALKSPHIGHGIDLGEVRGVPYAVYDYISGKNLESLLIQAANASSPIPVDHALLIAERLSLALSVATDTRAGDERIVHGFAVPHLVMVSNEGETRVLGFEAAAGLAEQAGELGPEITRYLAPELVASGRAERSDDVFTLGAVLFELLACRPLPAAAPEAYGGLIEEARVAYDGSSLPPEIAALLRKSLAPRGQRMADAGAWHKALTQVLADGGYAATTFNLAFFMHNLFRQEIEEESREIEQEKKTVTAPAAAPAIAAPAAAAATSAAAAPVDRRRTEGAGEARAAKSKVPLLAAAAVVILLLAGGGGWFLMKNRAAAAEARAAAQPTLPAAPVARPAAPEPQGPSPEEIQAQLAAMIDTRSDEMAAQLRDQYDQKIRELQGQLSQAQQDAAARETLVREQQRLEAERQAREAEAAEAAEAAKKTTPPVADSVAAKPPAGAPAGAGGAAASEPERVAEAARQAQPTPPPAVKKEPEPPAVKVGDLVGIGEVGVTPPELTRQPDVRYPAMARKLNKEADVDVRVLVDENGNVRTADLLGKKVGFGLDDAALDAARSAKYRPATKNGVRVKMYVNLRIRFDL